MAKKLNEKEKLALADKMAYKLNKYIEGLEAKLYRSELSEENWNKEMDKHPLFRGKTGKEIQKCIKHDPKNLTKEELALKYKEDGNFYVKHMKFPMAVCIFTEGIRVKCEKAEVRAILYNNRSAANFFLENFQGALTDAQRALKLKPNYEKARWRAAQCAFHTSELGLAAELSKEVIQNNEDRPEMQLSAFQLLAAIRHICQMVNFPLNLIYMQFYKKTILERICLALKERHVKFDDLEPNDEITEKVLAPKFRPISEFPVHLDKDGKTLFWPAMFGFPETRNLSLEVDLEENVILKDFLKDLCSKLCIPVKGNLNVYFVKQRKGKTHKIDTSKTIKAIVSGENYYIIEGMLWFHVVPAGTDIEKQFLERHECMNI